MIFTSLFVGSVSCVLETEKVRDELVRLKGIIEKRKEEVAEALLDCSHDDASVVSEIVAKCEDYNILSKPILPAFATPSGESEEEFLTQLCREGWRENLLKTG